VVGRFCAIDHNRTYDFVPIGIGIILIMSCTIDGFSGSVPMELSLARDSYEAIKSSLNMAREGTAVPEQVSVAIWLRHTR
jgi:hypothetical protein